MNNSVIAGVICRTRDAFESTRVCSVEPLIAVRDSFDLGNFMAVERSTSSGLVKCIAEQKKLFYVFLKSTTF